VVAAALSRAVRLEGRTVAQPLEEARTMLGQLADALVLDQEISGAWARKQLGWNRVQTDAVAELARS
jgi:hypothetical protein